MGAVLAAHDVAAKRCRAAGFDGRHHAELAQAQVASLMRAISRPGGAEDIRDLQGWTGQDRRRLRGWCLDCGGRSSRPFLRSGLEGEPVERPLHALDQLGRHRRIDRCRLQFFVAQHRLDHADVDTLLEQVRCERVPPMSPTT